MAELVLKIQKLMVMWHLVMIGKNYGAGQVINISNNVFSIRRTQCSMTTKGEWMNWNLKKTHRELQANISEETRDVNQQSTTRNAETVDNYGLQKISLEMMAESPQQCYRISSQYSILDSVLTLSFKFIELQPTICDTSMKKRLGCRQMMLQEMADNRRPTKYHTFLPKLQRWTQHKLVKPYVTMITSLLTNCTSWYASVYESNSKIDSLHSIKSIYYALFYSILISTMLYSAVHNTKPLCNFMEKQVVNPSNPLSKHDENNVFDILRSLKHFQPHDTDLQAYTAPEFPQNHNPALTIAIQQQLDAMSPSEFLPYVLNELTLDERESLMIDEGQRRKTFLVNWPYDKNLSGIRMAQAGFYCVNNYDRVQCVFCRGCLHKWEPNDIPINEHQKLFPFCRFVKGLECGNREYRSKKLTSDDTINITSYLPEAVNGAKRDSLVDSVSLGISTNRAAIPQYAPESARLASFRRWSPKIPVKPEDLCQAGFFYTGFDDQVRCFFCSGGLKAWSDTDKPWEEHARWFPECLYLIHQKGLEYINDIHDKTPENKKSRRKTKSQKVQEERENDIMSMQEEMFKLCEKLGHPTELITQAIRINGKPFDAISELLENVTDLENMGVLPKPLPGKMVTTDQIDGPMIEQPLLAKETKVSTPNGAQFDTKSNLWCKKCATKVGKFSSATHIGMPCGHLIFCDQCNEEEKRKVKSADYKVTCPFEGCGAHLSAGMKIYLA